LSTPTTKTLEHSGQLIFSFSQLRRVTGCFTSTFDEQIEQVRIPNSEGSNDEHFGQDSAGGAIFDSTIASSSIPRHHTIAS